MAWSYLVLNSAVRNFYEDVSVTRLLEDLGLQFGQASGPRLNIPLLHDSKVACLKCEGRILRPTIAIGSANASIYLTSVVHP
jgi:hypothetical protein